MSEFWYSIMSIIAERGWDYQSFSIFGPIHLFWLASALISVTICAILYRKFGSKGRRRFLIALSMFIVIYEAATLLAYALTDQWSNGVLPLHLCSFNIFVCAFYAWFPNKLTGDFLYGVCLPGALFALIVPSWTPLPLWNFFHIHSQILHIVLVMFPVLLVAGGLRPRAGSLWKIFAVLLSLCVPIFFLNQRLGTNFFFISGDDDNALLSALGDFLPDYRIGLVIIVFIVWFILFFPWAVSSRIKNKM